MRLPIAISEQSAEPLYYQIEVQLRALIISGSLQAGTLLPSIRELASQLKCSVITIKRVYSDLEAEGLLRTKQGTGTYVSHVEKESREEQKHSVVNEAIDQLLEAAERVQCTKQELEMLLKEKLQHYEP
ncbi:MULTISPECIES: GntR family transcriptional regulator [Paenibacillus]|uniref:GntR family transcriptional regulator n=1 Tax=Paenibacillus TaxID=44249 RepID=UPI00203D835E|nr:GntR family transcriptional regulator [Paenibacillus camelliae]MCM3634650.1 GntR family transcriptional regulator [Paenibacillus camelliae]